MAKRHRFVSALCLLGSAFIMFEQPAAAQNNQASLSCDVLENENRRLTEVLAKTAEQCMGKPSGLSEEGAELETLRQQNASLRETIKAQSDEMASNSGGVCSSPYNVEQLKSEAEKIPKLKQEIRTLRAENEHLSNGGGMGKTVTDQVMAMQGKLEALRQENENLQSDMQVYKDKIVAYEMQLESSGQGGVGCNNGNALPQETLDTEKLQDDVTALKLENQDLKARIELLQGQKK